MRARSRLAQSPCAGQLCALVSSSPAISLPYPHPPTPSPTGKGLGIRSVFVTPIRVFGMLLVVEWAAAAHHRNRLKVLDGRRRTGGPFQREGVPRVIRYGARLGHRPEEVDEEQQRAHRNREGANR